jgi:hypothetical protein
MATRVTASEVLAIMDSALAESDISAFLISANVFVTNNLESSGLSESVLKEIERWVTAHMVAITKERQSKDEGAGTAYIKYTGQWGEGLLQTSYGQMAINLDSSGILANLANNKMKASIFVVPEFD